MLHTGDFERDLIQMSFVANPREATSHLVGELLAEFARPLSDAFAVTMMPRAAARSWMKTRNRGGRVRNAQKECRDEREVSPNMASPYK
jgi:hypothetical protein